VSHSTFSPPTRSGADTTAGSGDSLFDTRPLDPIVLPDPVDLAGIAWRRRLLLGVVIVGCLAVFFLARWLALAPELPIQWRHASSGDLIADGTNAPLLRPFIGAQLDGIRTATGDTLPLSSGSLAHSPRWLADDATRDQFAQARQHLAEALAQGPLTLAFTDGRAVDVTTQPRGYLGLGTTFWLMSSLALLLFIVAWIVPLVQPQSRSALYALMALTQSGQLMLAAVASVPTLIPLGVHTDEALWRISLDLVTGAAIVQSAAGHPMNGSTWPRWLAGANWVAVGVYALLAQADLITHEWWWAQALLLSNGVFCFVLLTRAYRVEPHPFVLVMRRFSIITTATLGLLTLAVAWTPMLPTGLQPVAAVGPVVWNVFFASVVLLVPFIARSRSVMREFAMLAGISTLATSVDLLFVAVFSLSQFTSLTLSLFLALGTYAALRQWLLNQMMGARVVTTERVFQHLYRIAREVEARPERAADCLVNLLGHVFEPLDTSRLDGRLRHSRITHNGAVLLVPIPKLTATPTPSVEGIAVLRFAERGKRLFSLEDARLADRVVEQLMRALAHDRAVERGRSEERTRIAQDLHDDIGARLLTLMYKAPNKEMEDYVRHTLQDLKTLTRGLASRQQPLSLASAEWKTDIAHRLEAAGSELTWHFEQDADMMLSVVQWSSLTRILRELVSNGIAHAKAHHIDVRGQLLQGAFTLVISDDGIGRDPARWSHGLGLGGIRKRVKLLGGTVVWREREERGIVCTVTIPHLGATA
jgi:signal transduction histidine kinase